MLITDARGMTLIELIVCTLIIGILSTSAVPIARNVVRHEKEKLLRERLSEMRKAIDRYYEKNAEKEPGLADARYYPTSFDDLVDKRFLRRVPVDPFTEKADWKTRSSTDDPGNDISNHENIFDVYSGSDRLDLHGQPYKDW